LITHYMYWKSQAESSRNVTREPPNLRLFPQLRMVLTLNFLSALSLTA
jgi:hypothetical protein